MRMLCLHSNSLKWKAVKKAIKEPEEIKEKEGESKDCLTVFMSVEKRDESDVESSVKQLVKEVSDIAGKVGTENVVLYPYVHLTNSPSSPATALKALDLAEKALKKDFKVHRSPFGWYKAFEIDVKGHPLAELSREFGPSEKGSERKGTEDVFKLKDSKLDKDDSLKLTAAAVVAAAVKELYPEAEIGSFDIQSDQSYVDIAGVNVKEEVMNKIERKARGLLKKGLELKKSKKPSGKYQKEIAGDLGKKAQSYDIGKASLVPLYKNAFVKPSKVGALKLIHTGNAYWRGSADNPQLSRVYLAAFASEKELDKYVKKLEEAKKRSHTVIGEQMELYTMFDLVGKGLPVWLPRGEIIKREVENLAVDMEREYDYLRVSTPVLGKKELFEKSGHLPYYEDSMYPSMEMDDGTYYLKAMNCPTHHLIYNNKMRSYRDLPLRIAEYGLCHRNELSGTLTGLQRVRSMAMNDAHIYCRKDQIDEEVERVIKMIQEYYEIFGLKDYWFRLSKGDLSRKGKYIDQPKNWKYAEKKLKEVLDRLGVDYVEAEDEAAFYGPKIDVQFKNVFGKQDTMSTVQLDFVAKERFDMFYVDEDGKKNNEVFVIHRAPLSTHERFMAFLIEHYGGNFPLWLSPEQVRILTIADRHEDFAKDVLEKLRAEGVRAELDDRMESVGKKVRDAQVAKVNYMVTIGDKEMDKKTLAVRDRDGDVSHGVKVDEFVRLVVEKINSRK